MTPRIRWGGSVGAGENTVLRSRAVDAAGRVVVLETGLGLEISFEGSQSRFGLRAIRALLCLGLRLDGLGIIDQGQSRLSQRCDGR